MTTNEFLRKTLSCHYLGGLFGNDRIQDVRPRAACKDGFSVSIQAGQYLYCNPREDGAERYNSVELGFPSAEDDLIIDYAEDPGDPTGTVYGYVPVEIVDELMQKHGGIIGKVKNNVVEKF